MGNEATHVPLARSGFASSARRVTNLGWDQRLLVRAAEVSLGDLALAARTLGGARRGLAIST